MISCANKILNRSNNILSRRNKLKNKTCMSLSGFRKKPIENVINYKYLGLVFNASSNWPYSVDNLSTRGIKALFSLRR